MAAEEKLVVSIADLSTLIDKSPRSIEHAIQQGADWLPPGFRMGRKWCWLRKDIEAHLVKLADRKANKPRVGRPRRA